MFLDKSSPVPESIREDSFSETPSDHERKKSKEKKKDKKEKRENREHSRRRTISRDHRSDSDRRRSKSNSPVIKKETKEQKTALK